MGTKLPASWLAAAAAAAAERDAGAGRESVVMLLEQGPQPEPLVLEREQVCAVE